ncbi:hypothetical protein YPPY13_1984, partial [Yersinia pestis PY-13]
MSLTPFVMNLL